MDIPRVIQAIPVDDYKVYVYFDDNVIKLYDATGIIQKGSFIPLQDIEKFKKHCTVMNNTLSWDLYGLFDNTKSLDVDPILIYENSPTVDEPEWLFV